MDIKTILCAVKTIDFRDIRQFVRSTYMGDRKGYELERILFKRSKEIKKKLLEAGYNVVSYGSLKSKIKLQQKQINVLKNVKTF